MQLGRYFDQTSQIASSVCETTPHSMKWSDFDTDRCNGIVSSECLNQFGRVEWLTVAECWTIVASQVRYICTDRLVSKQFQDCRQTTHGTNGWTFGARWICLLPLGENKSDTIFQVFFATTRGVLNRYSKNRCSGSVFILGLGEPTQAGARAPPLDIF